MELFLDILVLLALISISHVLNRVTPFIPVPLIQIALGIVIVLFLNIHIPLNPELFFVLFIAPILFNDGKMTPRDELWKLRAPILLLAIGLVFITVIIGGYTVHAMIPAIPIAAAFGLAAILSPTDAVAVSSMSSRVQLPKRIHRLLEGEALMNDASGLVAFKFAIAAVVTGFFSVWQASVSFLIISLGGLLFGALISVLLIWFRMLLRRFGMEDVTVHMLILILTPFLLFILAEEFGLSGILAAVAGGIIHAIEKDHSRSEIVELRMVAENTWSVILFVLNGLVFIILGVQIPHVLNTIFKDFSYNNAQVIAYVIILYVLLIAIRFLWLYFFSAINIGRRDYKESISMRSIILLSVSGVRGALTLAGAFSIPLLLDNGDIFPQRNLIIFLAAGVILVSLLVASIALPLLTAKKSMDVVNEEGESENEAQIRAMSAAIISVKLMRNQYNELAVTSVIAYYEQRIAELRANRTNLESSTCNRSLEIILHRHAVAKQREFIQQMLKGERISRGEARRLLAILQRVEMVLTNRFRMFSLILSDFLNKALSPGNHGLKDELSIDEKIALKKLRIMTAEVAIEELSQYKEKYKEKEYETAAYNVIAHYRSIIVELRKQISDSMEEQYEDQKEELQMSCIQAERNELQMLFEHGKISRKQLSNLQVQVSYRESNMIEENLENQD
ncbi:sodium, potassium, lithium and rubidium/H(+) antiporter [Paenibacillus baekrokdamisoli]|uniref:Sodium, potassium, lithium and rubidium/H(+) antiporter n=1 Tax=Paenibacillus baekrokdamisoli TaxID=1712516 RepID=A0A3G9JB73_9BACL|nr:Na+/H+ antiporter [Paenibacillus baekrokdamisoli]MBB3072467.1 CPA1 family monovalent cation:H+ antiporter [Paenibacillus baekrokdamisoli]BBH20524.1 sodium, potassium, lithium and rubidium/H(+) antiporter [Paenibacillus baekrokdamisoli]